MVRTLRKDCPSCGKISFYVEGRRRTSCFYCGSAVVLPSTRGQLLVDFVCPSCATVSEVENASPVAWCPGCHSSFGQEPPGERAARCVRQVVSRERAVRLAEERGRGAIEEAVLFYAPYWLYQAVELGWVLGNEKLNESAPRKGAAPDPTRDDPAREIVAPVGGRLEYTKKEMHRQVREHLADPVVEPFGWKAVAKHTEAACLARFEEEEIAPGARVLRPIWSAVDAEREGARRAQQRTLLDERHFYRFFEHRVLLREGLSLVYHPFWVLYFAPPDVPGRESIPRDWMVIDGVAGDVTREPQSGGPPIHRFPIRAAPPAPPPPLALACPRCGIPCGRIEPGEVMVCESCMTPFEVGHRGPATIDARFALPHDVAESDLDQLVYLPIWRYRVKIRTDRRELVSRAQWKRFTRPIEVKPVPAEAKRSIVFYALAAGAPRAARLDALSLALTRLQPDLRFGAPVSNRALPAAYTGEDARRLAFPTYLTLFRDMTLKSIDGLKRTEIVAEPPELIFYPCLSRRGEVRDAWLGVTLQMSTTWDPTARAPETKPAGA